MAAHENAPSTIMLATHCAACGRPLCDAISVEMGIGPVCRKRLGLLDETFSEEARKEANAIVHWTAVLQTEEAFIKAHAELSALGFHELADKIYSRSHASKAAALEASPDVAGPVVYTLEKGSWLYLWTPFQESAVDALRQLRGRRWVPENNCNAFPLTMKRQVWSFLKKFFPGEKGMGDNGEFTIPGERAPF